MLSGHFARGRMAALFDHRVPVLDYGPRSHTDPGGRNERIYLLWPSWAFRIVAPADIHSRHVNELQKAVLGILRASRLTAVELGERLGIEPELVTFVISELQEQNWMNSEWEVTDKGTEILAEEREDNVSLVPGWVFKDPWNDSLWPFVAPKLQYAQTETDDSGHPKLVFGTTGRPWRQPAWRQRPPDRYRANPPDAQEIINAVVRQKRKAIHQENVEGRMHDDGLSISRIQGRDLKRIRTIEAEPEPVFLVSFLYVPRTGDDDLDWYACDFFGQGSDPSLRRLVVQEASGNQALAQRVQRLLGRTAYGSVAKFKNEVESRERTVSNLLEQMQLDTIAVAQPLAEVLEGWLELRFLQASSGRRHRRNVLIACRITLEGLFREVARKWPLTGVTVVLSPKDTKLSVKLSAAADAVGLTELPQRLRSVPFSFLRAVSKKRSQHWRLSPLVAATLLQAQVDLDHPLRSAANKEPDFLMRIDRVIQRGNREAHDSKDRHLDLASVGEAVEDTLEIVGLLLNRQTAHVKEALQQWQKGE